jgi:hypothetical protein
VQFQPPLDETPDAKTPESIEAPGSPDGASGPAPTGRRERDRTTMALLFIVSLVAVGALGYAFGRVSAPSSAGTGTTTAIGTAGAQRVVVGNTITGTVQRVTPTSVTIRVPGGTVVVIALNGATSYTTETPATIRQISVGGQIFIQLSTAAPGASADPAGLTRPLTANDVVILTP